MAFLTDIGDLLGGSTTKKEQTVTTMPVAKSGLMGMSTPVLIGVSVAALGLIILLMNSSKSSGQQPIIIEAPPAAPIKPPITA